MSRLITELRRDLGPDFAITLTTNFLNLFGPTTEHPVDYNRLWDHHGDDITALHVGFYDSGSTLDVLRVFPAAVDGTTHVKGTFPPDRIVAGVDPNPQHSDHGYLPPGRLTDTIRALRVLYPDMGGVFGAAQGNTAWHWAETVAAAMQSDPAATVRVQATNHGWFYASLTLSLGDLPLGSAQLFPGHSTATIEATLGPEHGPALLDTFDANLDQGIVWPLRLSVRVSAPYTNADGYDIEFQFDQADHTYIAHVNGALLAPVQRAILIGLGLAALAAATAVRRRLTPNAVPDTGHVTLPAAVVRTGLPIPGGATRGGELLDAATHPTVEVRTDGDGGLPFPAAHRLGLAPLPPDTAVHVQLHRADAVGPWNLRVLGIDPTTPDSPPWTIDAPHTSAKITSRAVRILADSQASARTRQEGPPTTPAPATASSSSAPVTSRAVTQEVTVGSLPEADLRSLLQQARERRAQLQASGARVDELTPAIRHMSRLGVIVTRLFDEPDPQNPLTAADLTNFETWAGAARTWLEQAPTTPMPQAGTSTTTAAEGSGAVIDPETERALVAARAWLAEHGDMDYPWPVIELQPAAAADPATAPREDADLRRWLERMAAGEIYVDSDLLERMVSAFGVPWTARILNAAPRSAFVDPISREAQLFEPAEFERPLFAPAAIEPPDADHREHSMLLRIGDELLYLTTTATVPLSFGPRLVVVESPTVGRHVGAEASAETRHMSLDIYPNLLEQLRAVAVHDQFRALRDETFALLRTGVLGSDTSADLVRLAQPPAAAQAATWTEWLRSLVPPPATVTVASPTGWASAEAALSQLRTAVHAARAEMASVSVATAPAAVPQASSPSVAAPTEPPTVLHVPDEPQRRQIEQLGLIVMDIGNPPGTGLAHALIDAAHATGFDLPRALGHPYVGEVDLLRALDDLESDADIQDALFPSVPALAVAVGHPLAVVTTGGVIHQFSPDGVRTITDGDSVQHFTIDGEPTGPGPEFGTVPPLTLALLPGSPDGPAVVRPAVPDDGNPVRVSYRQRARLRDLYTRFPMEAVRIGMDAAGRLDPPSESFVMDIARQLGREVGDTTPAALQHFRTMIVLGRLAGIAAARPRDGQHIGWLHTPHRQLASLLRDPQNPDAPIRDQVHPEAAPRIRYDLDHVRHDPLGWLTWWQNLTIDDQVALGLRPRPDDNAHTWIDNAYRHIQFPNTGGWDTQFDGWSPEPAAVSARDSAPPMILSPAAIREIVARQEHDSESPRLAPEAGETFRSAPADAEPPRTFRRATTEQVRDLAETLARNGTSAANSRGTPGNVNTIRNWTEQACLTFGLAVLAELGLTVPRRTTTASLDDSALDAADVLTAGVTHLVDNWRTHVNPSPAATDAETEAVLFVSPHPTLGQPAHAILYVRTRDNSTITEVSASRSPSGDWILDPTTTTVPAGIGQLGADHPLTQYTAAHAFIWHNGQFVEPARDPDTSSSTVSALVDGLDAAPRTAGAFRPRATAHPAPDDVDAFHSLDPAAAAVALGDTTDEGAVDAYEFFNPMTFGSAPPAAQGDQPLTQPGEAAPQPEPPTGPADDLPELDPEAAAAALAPPRHNPFSPYDPTTRTTPPRCPSTPPAAQDDRPLAEPDTDAPSEDLLPLDTATLDTADIAALQAALPAEFAYPSGHTGPQAANTSASDPNGIPTTHEENEPPPGSSDDLAVLDANAAAFLLEGRDRTPTDTPPPLYALEGEPVDPAALRAAMTALGIDPPPTDVADQALTDNPATHSDDVPAPATANDPPTDPANAPAAVGPTDPAPAARAGRRRTTGFPILDELESR